ncbi:MAG: TPM domain-containing protein [Ruminococcus sp.]
MKKFFGFLTLISVLVTAGCSDNNSSEYSLETVTTLQTTGIVTEAVITQPAEEKLVLVSENNYIYDNAKILSDEDLKECNNYAGWINSKLMLNTAVVTTNKLENLTPEKYAEKCYNEIFKGMGSGLLLLINNDTNKDYLYKQGTASLYITEQAEKDAFFYATKSIVSGDYKSGILELLSLAENCPKCVFDNGSLFNTEQLLEFESTLAMQSDINAFVFTTNNITEKSNAELAKDFYDRYSSDGKSCKMLFIDKKLGEAVLTDDSGEKSNDKISQLVKANDYCGAVREYFKVIGIVSGSNP